MFAQSVKGNVDNIPLPKCAYGNSLLTGLARGIPGKRSLFFLTLLIPGNTFCGGWDQEGAKFLAL